MSDLELGPNSSASENDLPEEEGGAHIESLSESKPEQESEDG